MLCLCDFVDYCEVFKCELEVEFGELVSVISINVMVFFCEMYYYDLLVEKLLFEWLEYKC